MITYKLNQNNTFAQQFLDGTSTGEWANIETNEAYLKWVSEGNTPLPAENE